MAGIKRFNLTIDEEYNFYLESLQNQYKLKKKKMPSPQQLIRNLLREKFESISIKDNQDSEIENSPKLKSKKKQNPRIQNSKNANKKYQKNKNKQQIKSKKTIGTQLIPSFDPLEELKRMNENE